MTVEEHRCIDYFEAYGGPDSDGDIMELKGYCTQCDKEMTLVYKLENVYTNEPSEFTPDTETIFHLGGGFKLR